MWRARTSRVTGSSTYEDVTTRSVQNLTMLSQAVLYTDAFSSFAFPTRRVSVSRPQQRFGQDALRGHGPALDVEDAQSRLLWNSVSRRVARGGCLREHARCANAGPDRGAATGHAGQRRAGRQSDPAGEACRQQRASRDDRGNPDLHLRSSVRCGLHHQGADQGWRRGRQRSDQRDARSAHVGEGLLLARARANRHDSRHVQRSVQVHDWRGDHPCGPGAHRSA